jgi:putative hydrolase of the HAD superfamily
MLKALIFDMGGTLEEVVHKPEYNLSCGRALLSYLKRHGMSIPLEAEEFMDRLEERYRSYRKWGTEQKRELPPFELWSQWFLRDLDYKPDRLEVIADQLANLWERNFYRRFLRPEAPAMLEALSAQGLRLGLISNTSSHSQVIEILYRYGIRHYFTCIYLSVSSGFRKPHPELFLAAALDLEALPEECIYVGDTISRDVRGARKAGYRGTIRINSMLTEGADGGPSQEKEEADYLITSLDEIPGIVSEICVKTHKEKL